jgi:hypothetical protein
MADSEIIQRRREGRRIDMMYSRAIEEASRQSQTNNTNIRTPRKIDLGTVVAWGVVLSTISACGYFVCHSVIDYFSK